MPPPASAIAGSQGSLMAQSAALMGMSAPMSLPQQGPTSSGAAAHLLQQQRAGGAGGQQQSSLSPVSPGLYNLTRGGSSRPLPVLPTAAGNATMAGANAHTIMNGQQQPPTEAEGSMPLKQPSTASHSAATMRAAMAQRQLQSQSRHQGATPAGALLGPKKGLLENAGAPALAASSAATPAKDNTRPS
eukprot:SM000031S11574  [mRNA]  locus=s31:452621:453810:+ [translate_table: standard]